MKSLCIAFVCAIPALAAPCESLLSLKLSHTTISSAEARPAGEFALPGKRSVPGLPPFCRVSGVLRPSADSDIRFEVWLPAPASWNGKFQGVGNGGYAGAIEFNGLLDAVSHNYATASTNTGHEDSGTSAQWALNHPEKIVDFGYRAIHETALTAKALIHAYYGEDPKHSYFNSCSNGGRQALMEAQRFPEDYEGIIAGAPANNWTHLLSSAAAGVKAMLSEAASYLPATKLPAIEAAALAQCDAKDGVKDGVIENPLSCRFDPAVLLCKGEESDACLTTHQMATLKTVYAGLSDSKGRQLMPGLSPGGEAEQGTWAAWVTGPAPEKSQMYLYGTQFFKNMLYNKPDWDFKTFDPDRDPRQADDRLANVLNSTNPDLSAFEKRGGKLLMYHGWADAAIPALNAIQYYNSVNEKMGPEKTASFSRLYMVPGMGHCTGGPGANAFGQLSTPDGDRFHSLDAALEAWVEKGAAPGEIIATKYKTPDRSSVVRTHPLCPWPQTAKYKGTGSSDDASNYTCSAN